MRITLPWALLIAYMTLAILLAGYMSGWPWLGLLAAIMVRVYIFRPAPVAVPQPAPIWQGPHFLRRRRGTHAERSDSSANDIL